MVLSDFQSDVNWWSGCAKTAILTRFSAATPSKHVGSKNGDHHEILREISHIIYIQSVNMRQMVVYLMLFERLLVAGMWLGY